MAQASRLQHLIVGSVFLGGIFLLGLATLLIRGVPWAEEKTVEARFPSVQNLATGEKVVVQGVHVGEVREIIYDPSLPGGRNVLVRFTIDRDVPLTDNTEFRVRSAGPLGGHYVEIVPQPGEPKPPEWQGFTGRADGDVFEQIERLVQDLRQDEGLLPRLIRDEELARKTESTIDEFRRTFATINLQITEGRGLLGRLFHDEQLANEVERSVTSFGNTFSALNTRDAATVEEGSLVSDAKQLFRDVREQKGIVGMLISDTEARDQLKSTIAELQEVVGDASEKQGVLYRLFNDEQLGRRVDEIVTDFHNVIHKIDSGEGTLGQLVNNREVWSELVRILVLARESIEDLREQAPINTFANVLFSVF